MAAASGENGDIPWAIKSALTKFLQLAYFGRKLARERGFADTVRPSDDIEFHEGSYPIGLRR
jgi:hypothetical protein